MVQSHWNQKPSKKKKKGEEKSSTRLCSQSPRPRHFTVLPSFRPSIVHLSSSLMCTHLKMHTHTHWHNYIYIAAHRQTGTGLTSCILTRTHTRTHVSVTIICMQSVWRQLVAMVAVTRLCDKKLWVALPPICANWERCQHGNIYRAKGEKITPPVGTRRRRTNNGDGGDARV